MLAATAAEVDLEQAALVRAAQGGDRSAFGTLYERYARMVHGILLAHVSYTDAEDLVQDVFVRAMQQLRSLRDPAAFGGWLGSIARRLAVDVHRKYRPVSEARERPGASRPDEGAF